MVTIFLVTNKISTLIIVIKYLRKNICFIKQISRTDLLKPLQAVVGIVERKQPLPILSNVLLKKNNNGLDLLPPTWRFRSKRSSKLNFNPLPAQTRSQFRPKNFRKYCVRSQKKVPSIWIFRKINSRSKQTRAVSACKLYLRKIFPALTEQLDGSVTIEIEQGKLKRLLASVQHAMAQQDIRYYLNGVLLVIDGSAIKLIATDGIVWPISLRNWPWNTQRRGDTFPQDGQRITEAPGRFGR